MSSPGDRRLNHKVLPIPPPPSPLLPTNLPSTSNFIISNSSNLTSSTLKPNFISPTLNSTRVNKRSGLNEINTVTNNKWKLEDNNNLNYATLGVGVSNLTSNGTTSIKSRSSRDSAWITTNNNTTTNSNLNGFKNQGEDLTVRDSTVNFHDDFNNIRTRKDSFNSNSSRDSLSRIGTSSSNHSLRSIHSASDNFAALRAQFHSPSAETLNSIPSSPTRSSSRIGQSKSPATRIPRPSSRLSTTKSSPSLGSISPFEAKLSSHQPAPTPRHHPFKSTSIISQAMIPKTTYTTDLTSGEEGLEDGILLQHSRTTRSSSVELSELVGDVFGAIDWNSRRTGTPNKLDARTLPQSIDSKTPRKSTSQGDGMSFSTNSNKKGNKPALMEAFMGPSASWDSRSSNIRNREDRQVEEQLRQPQASTSTLPPRPVRRSLDSSLVLRQSITESPSSRRLQDAYSLSVSTSTIRDASERRPSMTSSVNSITSSAASIMYRGSNQPFPESDLDSPSDSLSQEGGSLRERDLRDHLHNEAEKRTRLALFLDETAAAMEGGKSLSMVLPVPASNSSDEGLSLSQLAEASPRPKSMQYKSTFINYRSSSPTPSTSSSSAAPSLGSLQNIANLSSSVPSISASAPIHSILSTTPFDESILSSFNTLTTDAPSSPTIQQTSSNRPPDRRRKTLYFTPTIQTAAESEANDTEDTIMGKRYSPVVEEGDYGLGFNIDMDMSRHRRTTSNGSANLALPLDKSSPATVRGVSPVMSFAAMEAARELASKKAQEAAELEEKIEEDKKEVAKMADKRRRTIHELLETEASYASDMVVVRDIYLARAKGTDMSAIADHVMSTGLGLGKPLSASPPSSPTTSPSGSFSGSLPPMIRRVSASLPVLEKGDPLMSKNDLHIVFANLEEIADLAEAFSAVLDSAMGSGEGDDNIGEIFVEMIPRIQQVFSTYCARHHRAILRLQDLEPSLRTFLGECKTLSHGRTNAWDLASLLIKPVQRCLKYPLLLDQILAVTPKDHPDRAYLKRANTDMLMVAEHINDVKKRNDLVGKLGGKKEGNPRTPTSSRNSSAGSTATGGFLSRSVTKKFLRTSSKSKQAVGLAEQEKDEMFDTLAALVETTKSTVLRFTSEMKEWSRSTKTALEAQASMVEGWIEVYAPLAGEAHTTGGGHERLCVFLETVLKPVIEGPWRALDQEVRQSLLLKTEHLLTLFDNPSAVIAKRNDKAADHAKFIAKKSSVDRRASEDFISLSSQLLEELPRFLSSVSRYFNIIIAHFATAQATYHKAVQQNWSSFADQWFVQPSFDSIESRSSFASQQLPVAQMMETLAAGLGIAATPAVVPWNRTASTPQASTTGSTPRVSRQRFSSAPGDHNGITTNRSSIASDSTPSFTLSSAGGSSSGTPATPPLPGSSSSYRTSKLFDHPDRRSSYTTDSGSFRTSMYGSSTFTLPSSAEDPPSRSSHYLGTGDRYDTDAPYLRNKATRRTGGGSIGGGSDRTSSSNSATARESVQETFLYTAAAMASTRSTGTRGGQKILNLKVGDLLQVELEEADDGEGGGPGWLYGKMENGERGWARTEDLGHV